MTEWTVVGVLVVLVGLFFSIYNPISKSTKDNTKAMTELTITLKELVKDFAELKEGNKNSHKRMHERNDRQDEMLQEHGYRLDNHETRISHLEEKQEGK